MLKHLRKLIVRLLPIIISPPIKSFAFGRVPMYRKSSSQLKIICS